jgi:ADP-ribose pyrophosphatase YjhB (NUDIX family)
MADRRYPPLPMIGVGVVLLSEDLDQVLLIERGAPPARGLWSFPGGLVRTGEPLREACTREALEETGLEVELGDVAKVVERIIPDDRGEVEYHFVIVDFWGRVTGGALAAASDARAAAWTPLARLKQLQTTRGVPEAVERAVRLARGERAGSALFEG